MTCERCSALRDNEAVVWIRTENTDLALCHPCAKVAYDLGLACELLAKPKASDGKCIFATAA